MNYAKLSNKGLFTFFSYKDDVIKFRTSKKLERYTKIKKWDNGFIVVDAKYRGLGEVEDYIDMRSILQNLYYNVDDFLLPIKEVRLNYE